MSSVGEIDGVEKEWNSPVKEGRISRDCSSEMGVMAEGEWSRESCIKQWGRERMA